MSSPIAKAVLLVGGQGTRLRPLTLRRPKAVVPLLGQPLLAYELSLLARYEIRDVVLAVGYRAEALRRHLGDGEAFGVRLTYVEEDEPLGTAGAIGNVRDLLDGPFFVLNGDLIYDVDLSGLAQAHTEASATVTFCLRRVADVSRYGLIECDSGGRVTAFREKQAADHTGRNTVNSGVYVMAPEVLGHIPAGQPFSNETDLFPRLLAAARPLVGYVPPTEGYWADAGTLEAYLEATQRLLSGAIPWVGPAISASARIDQRATVVPPVYIGPDVEVRAGATVGPFACIEPRCIVGSGAQVANCVLWDAAHVGDGCRLTNLIVADGVAIPDGTYRDGGAVVQ